MKENKFEEPTVEELKAAEKVINIDRKERGRETLSEAFINRIEETIGVGDTGYVREVVFPIPIELIHEDEETRAFIQKVGVISRNDLYGLPVKMEDENSMGVNTMNLIISPSSETNLEAIKRKLA